MDEPDFLGTGWSFPTDLASGRFALASDEAKIAQSILLILRTAKGERVMEADFGSRLGELLFAAIDTATIESARYFVLEALQKWEPRITVEAVAVAPDANRQGVLWIEIDYVIRAKNSRRNLVYPFYLNPDNRT